MLRFEDPIFLWLLWIIPVLILIRLIGWRRRKAKLKKLGDPELLKQLMPNISKYRPTVKFVLMLAALALLIVMVARPQMGSKISHDKRHGIETIICLDINTAISFTQFYSWGVSKQSPALLDSLNTWLSDFRKKGEYQSVYRKYYGKQ